MRASNEIDLSYNPTIEIHFHKFLQSIVYLTYTYHNNVYVIFQNISLKISEINGLINLRAFVSKWKSLRTARLVTVWIDSNQYLLTSCFDWNDIR